MFSNPVKSRGREVVFSDKGFPDGVGVCKSSGRVGEEIFEGEGFVCAYLEEGCF